MEEECPKDIKDEDSNSGGDAEDKPESSGGRESPTLIEDELDENDEDAEKSEVESNPDSVPADSEDERKSDSGSENNPDQRNEEENESESDDDDFIGRRKLRRRSVRIFEDKVVASALSEDGNRPGIRLKKLTQCKECGKIVSAANISKHLKTHSKVYTHECPFCKKMCRTSSDLKVHTMIHTGEKPFVCKICQRGFVQKAQLLAHMTIHTDERKFLCSVCGAAFRQLASLNTHIKYHHTRERKHACKYCGRRFIEFSTMRIHERIHTAETPFLCSVCGKGFPSSGRLRIHSRTHTGERPYMCQVCKKTFSQRNSLTRHIRIHTGARPHACQVCGKSFSQTGILDRHMRKHGGKPKKPPGSNIVEQAVIRDYYKDRIMDSSSNPATSDIIPDSSKDRNSGSVEKPMQVPERMERQIPNYNQPVFPRMSMEGRSMESFMPPYALDGGMDVRNMYGAPEQYNYRSEWEMSTMSAAMKSYSDYQSVNFPPSIGAHSQLNTSAYDNRQTDYGGPMCLKTGPDCANSNEQPGHYDYRAGMPFPNMTAALKSYTEGQMSFEPETPAISLEPKTDSKNINIKESDKYSKVGENDANDDNDFDEDVTGLETTDAADKVATEAENSNEVSQSEAEAPVKMGKTKKSKRKADNPMKNVNFAGSSRRKAGLRIRRVNYYIETSDESEPDSVDMFDSDMADPDFEETYGKKTSPKRRTSTAGRRKASTEDKKVIGSKKTGAKRGPKKGSKREKKSEGAQRKRPVRTPCPVCSKNVRTDYLPLHLKRHSGERTHKCTVCEKLFLLAQDLKVHMNIHLGEKPFRCFVCDKRFAQKAQLNAHSMIHTDERPCLCNICGKAFRQKGELERHMRSHTGAKPYICDYCGRGFAESGTLTAHKRTHTGEAPFICEVCGKAFKMRNILRTHMRIHDGLKPYSCEVCEKTFAQKSSLNRHMRIHTGEKPCVCQVCGDRFTQSGILDRHMRKHGGKPKKVDPYKINMNKSQTEQKTIHPVSEPPAPDSGPSKQCGYELEQVVRNVMTHSNRMKSNPSHAEQKVDNPQNNTSSDKGPGLSWMSSRPKHYDIEQVVRNVIGNNRGSPDMPSFESEVRSMMHGEAVRSHDLSTARNLSHDRNMSHDRHLSHNDRNLSHGGDLVRNLSHNDIVHHGRSMSHSDLIPGRGMPHNDPISSRGLHAIPNNNIPHPAHCDPLSMRNMGHGDLISSRNITHGDPVRNMPHGEPITDRNVSHHDPVNYGQKPEHGDSRMNMLHSLPGPIYPPWPPGPGGFCY